MAQSSVISAICGAENTGFGQNLRVSQRNVGAKIMGVVAQSSVASAICGAQNTGFGQNPRLCLRNVGAKMVGFWHNPRLHLRFVMPKTRVLGIIFGVLGIIFGYIWILGSIYGCLLYFKSFCRPVPCGGKTSLLSGQNEPIMGNRSSKIGVSGSSLLGFFFLKRILRFFEASLLGGKMLVVSEK